MSCSPACAAIVASLAAVVVVLPSSAQVHHAQSAGAHRPAHGPIGPYSAALVSSSPANGETGVSLTRETILRFDQALDPTSAFSGAISVTSVGQNLPFNSRVSADRHSLTLFYVTPLPEARRVRVTIDGSLMLDWVGRLVDADSDGIPGGVRSFEFDTTSITPFAGTKVSGRVFASELAPGSGSINVPLEGARVSVDGAESTLFALTDANGTFTLDPAPAGRIFVHIDGTTATNPTPSGGYYPTVGKAWETHPGQELNVGDAFLPLVPAGTLQNVSTTSATTITMAPSVLAARPELAGTQITVPAGALFYDNGTPGTQVGIAPVPPDRLPGPLPAGLDFPIVITVQTDGAGNFDAPAVVRFPNLPRPGTGQPLPPLSGAFIWSFNHDSGRWEAVAPARVTADGQFIESLSGGIRAPGWHGVATGLNIDLETPTSPCGDGWTPCLTSALNSAVTCAMAIGGFWGWVGSHFFSGGFNCELGIVRNAISVMRNCIGTGVGNGSCTTRNLTSGFISSTLGCIGGRASPVGRAVSCINAIISEAQTCSCGLLAPPPSSSLQATADYLAALAAVHEQAFGSPVWTSSFDPLTDPFEHSSRAAAILSAAETARDPSSDAGGLISAAEEAAVVALPRPAYVASTDVTELVGYLNRTFANWQVGILTHAQAGTNDFTDRDQMMSALNDLETSSVALAQEIGVGSIDYPGLLQRVHEALLRAVAGPSQSSVDSSRIRVASQSTGFGLPGPVLRTTLTLFRTAPAAPDTTFRVTVLDTSTLQVGETVATTPRLICVLTPAGGSGCSIVPPDPYYGAPVLFPNEEFPDSDADGLSDRGEFVVGTDPNDHDSDNDGVTDAAEVLQGLDPLDGVAAESGIVATAPTAANALDVAAFDDLAVVARGTAGVCAYNVFSAMPPILVAQVDTPGDAREADLSERFIAVADGPAGLAVIDASDLAAASIVHQVPTSSLGGGAAQCVAVAGGIAFVGTGTGRVAAVDLSSGAVIDIVDLGASVHDFAIDGERLFVVTGSQIRELRVFDLPLVPLGTASLFGDAPVATGRRRVHVGDGRAYVTHKRGYQILDVATRGVILSQQVVESGQVGWTQLVANGPRVGVATVGTDVFGTTNDVALYDLTSALPVGGFIASFETPGETRGLSLYGGLAYVADAAAGMQVVNYRGYDNLGVAPTVALAPAPDLTQYTELSTLLVRAITTDDVQIRTVELLLDGRKVQTDGNFPYQFFLELPEHVLVGSNTHTLQLRASDTGGNATLTPLRSFDVVADATPPNTQSTFPVAGAALPLGFFDTFAFSILASEGLTSASLAGAVELRSAGPDLALDTSDDVLVPFQASLAAADRRVIVRSTASVGIGDCRLRLRANQLRDRAGNAYDGNGDGNGGDDFTLSVHVTNDITAFWDGGGDGSSWHDAQNWSTNAVPGAADRVLIDAPLATVVHSSGATSVTRLTTRTPLAISGGTLSIAEPSQIAALTLSGSGVLGGSSDITLVGSSTWSAGRIEGAGRLIVASGATLTTFGNAPERQRELENHGAVVLGGNFTGPMFANASDGLLRVLGSCNMSGSPFDNDGVVRIEAGELRCRSTNWRNDAAIYVDAGQLVFDAGGPASMVQAGLIRIASGAHFLITAPGTVADGPIQGAGSVTIGQGANVTVSAPFAISGGFTHTGGISSFAAGSFLVSGAVAISGGMITIRNPFTPSSFTGIGSAHVVFDAPQTIAALSLAGGGVLDGSGDVTITGTLDSSGSAGGQAAGSGLLVLAHGATFTSSALTLFDRPFECHGATQITASEWRGSGSRLIASDGSLVLAGGHLGGALLTNQGTWSVVANAQVRVGNLQNQGSLVVNAGELDLAGGAPSNFTNSGTISVAADATFKNSGNTLVSTGPINAAGNVLLTNGSSHINGVMSCSQLFRLTGGAHSFAVGAFQATGTVELNSGMITIRDTIAASSFSGPNAAHAVLEAPQSFATVALNGGVLDGSGTVTVTGSMSWSGAEVRAGGRLVLAPGATLSIGGGGTLPLQRVLENHGSVTQSASVGRVQVDSGGGLENASDGLFEIQGESDISGNGTLVNAGTFRHTGSGTSQLIASSVTNTGSFECLAGTLRFEQAWTNNGTLSAAAGAVLRTQGALTLTPSSTLRIGIDSTSSFGECVVTGAMSYNGLLDLVVAGSYIPVVNDTFAVVTHASWVGTFASLQGDQLGGGLALAPSYSSAGLALTVQ